MQDKIVLITGADGGIGRETTRGIAKNGATIIMACIDLNLARPVCEAIKQESGNSNLDLMQIDLASLPQSVNLRSNSPVSTSGWMY